MGETKAALRPSVRPVRHSGIRRPVYADAQYYWRKRKTRATRGEGAVQAKFVDHGRLVGLLRLVGGERVDGIKRASIGCLVLAVLAAACAAPQSPGAAREPGASAPRAGPAVVKKRFTAALLKPDLASLRTGVESGANRVIELIHAGLARTDPRGDTYPQLAEAIPTLENDLWKLLPDGRMETSWRIRADAYWHDGTPVTSDDFLFGAQVEQDKDVPWRAHAGFQFIESIQAPDSRTVALTWKKPYVFADVMAGEAERLLPRHILQQPYLENRAAILEHPYWTIQFVGAGPFKVRDFVHGGHVLLEAFDQYVFGRPKVDEIEVKFIPDSATLVANLLAGAVDLTLGLTLAPDEAANLRNQWRVGTVYTSPYFGSSVGIAAQFINSNPAVVANLQFRRALLHAADRQALIDSIMAGASAIAHSFIAVPLEGIESSVVRYDYDLRRAAQLIEGLGYRKGSSGAYEDAAGQRLSISFWAIQEEQERAKAMLAVAEDWKRAGLDVQPFLVPAQQQDPEYLATYPAFFVRGIGGGETALQSWLHGSSAPRPENRFRGNNRSRYVNGEFDALIDRFYATIPRPERTEILGQIIHHLTSEVVGLGLFYNVDSSMLNNRLVNVTASTHKARGWDAHSWDVR